MPAQFKRKQSKRLTCHKKYKILKKVREHNRKLRKEAKKNPNKKSKKPDPGVPSCAPFKEEVLKIAEDRKQRLQEERERMKERRKKQRERVVRERRSLTSLVSDAEARTAQFDQKQTEGATDNDVAPTRDVENSRKAYYKEFKKVVDAADVILQVLDARDPIGSRCPEVEEAVLNSGPNKRLVLVLNKIDLVPKEIVEKWLQHLRNEFPAVAFKASTQTQRENLSHCKVPVSLLNDELYKSSRCLGAEMLMKLLSNYCRNKDIKTSITVGVVGFPNTGKSSLINSLKRSKACNVGATPGVTKQMQEIHLDKHIKLLDSPGIVMARGDSDAAVILRNCVKIETIDDPSEPVAAILKRCNKEKLMLHYRIPNYADVHEFLALMAKRFGQLKKGGIPDINKAARTVLQDWTSGKITYYTHPPEQHSLPSHVSAAIVSEMKKEFSLDELITDEAGDLKELKTVSSNHMVIESEGPTQGLLDPEPEMEESDDNMETMADNDEEELKDVVVDVKTKTKKKSSAAVKEKKLSDDMNRQSNRLKKMEMKKLKKTRKRADALSTDLSEVLTGAMSLGSPEYDFNTDYK